MDNTLAKLSISDKVNEGRKRILTCLSKKGAEEDHVNLLELQKQYFMDFETYLNKDELRRFFSKTHIKQVFESFMPKDIEMTTDVEQTGSLYLKMKRPLGNALADGPLAQKRSAVSKTDTTALNLVPLPSTKAKFENVEIGGHRPSEKSVGNLPPPKHSIWEEVLSDKQSKSDSTKTKAFETITRSTAKDLYSSDELEIGLENKDVEEFEDEEEDEEGEDAEDDENSDYFGDEALEANNRFLSSEKNFSDNKGQQTKTGIGIRSVSHAEKYIIEAQKRRVEKENAASTNQEKGKIVEESAAVVKPDEDLETKRIMESARARLALKKLEHKIVGRRIGAAAASVAPVKTKSIPSYDETINKKMNNNFTNNNNNILFSSDEEEEEEMEKTRKKKENEGGVKKNGKSGKETGKLKEAEEDEEEESDEPLIILSKAQGEEEEASKKRTKGQNEVSSPEELRDFVVDDDLFYKGVNAGTNNEKKKNVFNKGNSAQTVTNMSENMRFEMVAIATLLVRIHSAIKLDKLHRKLTCYNPNMFGSPSELLSFMQQNCFKNVQVHKCLYNTTLLIWSETAAAEIQHENGGMTQMLQKLGKALCKEGED